ncbi:hypothetical protein [Gordoniibacillus kamchatkensis]|nr:hypothetical protein [Paenibacillus sp. VKM B-2647]
MLFLLGDGKILQKDASALSWSGVPVQTVITLRLLGVKTSGLGEIPNRR